MAATNGDPLPEEIELAGNVVIPAGPHLLEGEDHDVEITLGSDRGRAVARAITVRQREGGDPVTGEALRQVRVAALVREAVRRSKGGQVGMTEEGRRLWEAGVYPYSDEDLKRMRSNGPTDETLKTVAWVYRMAHAVGEAPTAAVEEVFELPRSTAGRWVSLARKRDFLGRGRPGKAGGD
jgi:hypothetical protein